MPQTTQPCSSSHVVVGATSAATIINGVGVDTFTPGTGYDGGNDYVASAQDYQNGFIAFGSCANYASLACRVTVNTTPISARDSTPTVTCCGPTPTAAWSRSRPPSSTEMW
jgi:hypothetical protein